MRSKYFGLISELISLAKKLDDAPVPTEGRMSWPSSTAPERCVHCGMPLSPDVTKEHLCPNR